MKIDLHLHSKLSSWNGDSIKWESLYESLKRINNNNVKVISFTDHNIFNVKFYNEVKELSKTGGIITLPGTEVNVVTKSGIVAHMLIIFNNNLTDNQLQKIEDSLRLISKTGVSINNINNFLSEYDSIRIIHIGKTDYFRPDDLINLNYDAFEISNHKHHNLKKVLKEGYESSLVSFSDTHSWDVYPQQKTLFTDMDIDINNVFYSIKKALSMKKDYTKKRINND